MNKWIDIEDLRMCVNILADKMTDSGAVAIKQAVNIADSLPSIDIVRCKECRHGTYYEDAEMYICNAIDQVAFDADHFCSYGERKE